MRSIVLRVLGALVPVFCVCGVASAASWTVTSGVGNPGQTVNIDLRLAGDGQTVAAQVELAFDETRLSLPVASGSIPGASLNSQAICARVGSNRVAAMRVGSDGSLVPSATTALCRFPFQIRSNAPGGLARIVGGERVCSSGDAQPVAVCTAGSGGITVNAPLPPPPPVAVAPPVLEVMLRADDDITVERIVDAFNSDPSSVPIEPFIAIPPLDVRPLMRQRAEGDFAALLREEVDSPRARLERYLVVTYDERADIDTAEQALRNDPNVEAVFRALPVELPLPPGRSDVVPAAKTAANQYHLAQLNLPQAWERAGGWGLVGAIDTGIDTDHPGLRAFAGNTFVKGSFLAAHSFDFGGVGANGTDSNVDEGEVVPAGASDAVCAPVSGYLVPKIVGHGTHVSGLIAAKHMDADSIDGACVRCGVGMLKVARHVCDKSQSTPVVFPTQSEDDVALAVGSAPSFGVQVLNMSFMLSAAMNIDLCRGPNADPTWPMRPACLAIEEAAHAQILMVGSSGNYKRQIDFPASDPLVVAAGGMDATGFIWDDNPGSSNCAQCGSNYTTSPVQRPRQELVAPAKDVRSLFYVGGEWNPTCSDAAGDGAVNDGIGLCTGTSMSAPIVSGMFGLLRSINPLVPPGNGHSFVMPYAVPPELASIPTFGVRNVVVATAHRPVGPTVIAQNWNQRYGWGIPDAAAAADVMLGTVRGQVVKNRVTPLFGLYSAAATDYATVATPQLASALRRDQANAYRMSHQAGDGFIQGWPITGYSNVPMDTSHTARARAYVLTTEYNPKPGKYPPLIPLYLMSKDLGSDRDFLLVSSDGHVQSVKASGFDYRGLQGYIYQTCTPSPACIPPGAQQLWRKCKTGAHDCAVFLEGQRASFEAAGYTAAFPSGQTMLMGYAYTAADSDGDGLIDGFEHVIGTHPNDSDSDNDGLSDRVEFPMTGVSTSDPCSGPTVSCLRPEKYVFDNGFE